MSNLPITHRDTAVLSVAHLDAPETVTSAWIDEQLDDTYSRLAVRPGQLESVAGIVERRWWPSGTLFSGVAAAAGEEALARSGVDRSRVGLVIDSSVCRDHLEPSAAVAVHHLLGLPSSCLNFDLANACLGFVNAMTVASALIDSGQVEYALIVDGEGSRALQEVTIERLAGRSTTAEELYTQFASLTLGSAAAAMVLGPASRHPEGHRLVASESRVASEHHLLCVGDLSKMRTDTSQLMAASMEVVVATLTQAEANGRDWQQMDHYIIHQVSKAHSQRLFDTVAIAPERTPLTFRTRGNVGPASIPLTLSVHEPNIESGDRVLLGGIGSGINTMACELIW